MLVKGATVSYSCCVDLVAKVWNVVLSRINLSFVQDTAIHAGITFFSTWDGCKMQLVSYYTIIILSYITPKYCFMTAGTIPLSLEDSKLASSIVNYSERMNLFVWAAICFWNIMKFGCFMWYDVRLIRQWPNHQQEFRSFSHPKCKAWLRHQI